MMQSVSASPLSLSLYTHSHYHAQQPFLHKVNFLHVMHNSNHSSPFPLWRDNKVNCLQMGAPSFLVYSNYPVCLPINTPDQSSLGKLKGEKQRNQGAEKDRQRSGGGFGGRLQEVTKQAGKKACGRGEISKGVKSGGRHGKGKRASRGKG